MIRHRMLHASYPGDLIINMKKSIKHAEGYAFIFLFRHFALERRVESTLV